MQQQEKAQILEYLNKFNHVFNDMLSEVTQRVLTSHIKPELNPFLQAKTVTQVLNPGIRLDSQQFLRQQFDFMQKQQELWQNATKVLLGENLSPVVKEERGDKRFADGDWHGNPVFSYIKQSYLLNAEYMQQLVDTMEFDDTKMRDQVRFYTRQLVNSMSPSNYVFTNPEVCREILATEGECLARGIDNFMRDLEKSPADAFKITQVDESAFILGENLAYTPGAVIYKNELIELIHYTATTEQVQSTPLLIVPPFINKYYILDLDAHKSMVRWLVAQGFDVYMISWLNPSENACHFTFDDYVQAGVIAALNTVTEFAGVTAVNAAGYCVGGTLLSVAQAWLASQNDTRIQSLTLLTTLLDFSEPGEVGNYLNVRILPLLEQSIQTKGYLDGRVLALSFSLLRENNLFWSFFIDNYLKGKDPMPFDILYWNSDSTNIPAQAYWFYLQNMYINNALKEPNAIRVCGQAIDLNSIQVPCYCLAAMADHIVLWPAAYRSATLLTTDVRFVLAESGHVAGVVNPADTGKYPHWTNTQLPETADAWLASATQQSGSWWWDWCQWLRSRSGEQVAARAVTSPAFPMLAPAPGDYVKRRLA